MKKIRSLLVFILLVLATAVTVFVFKPWKALSDTSQNNQIAEKETFPSDMARMKGCDISHWDGDIDWPGLKKTDIRFLFIKATQGTEYVDPKFKENWSSAKHYEFYRGAYHFYQPNEDPKKQAEHFLSVVQNEKGDIIPTLDIEIAHGVSREKLTEDVGIWIKTVQEALGRPPMIYTDKAFWDKSIDRSFSHCPLWIAEWETGHDPYLPRGWKQWVFWQYSATGSVNGIPEARGKVDLDYFHGHPQELKSYLLR